jgi:maleate isomerase
LLIKKQRNKETKKQRIPTILTKAIFENAAKLKYLINMTKPKIATLIFLASLGMTSLCLVSLVGCGIPNKNPSVYEKQDDKMEQAKRTIVGKLSGKTIFLADPNRAPMPAISSSGVVKDGQALADFKINTTPGNPDARSYRRKFGLLIPATNTSMEHELWSIIFDNQQNGLDGVGIHVANIITPKTKLQTNADLDVYKTQFIDGLNIAIDQVALAQPEYLIMGMSLEHILFGMDEIRGLMTKIERQNPYSWATWHEAADAALKKYKAKRIGLISPFSAKGNANAKKMFEDLGYEVVTTFGFACANAYDIAHIPDSAKEEAILKHIAIPENKLDAVLQLGTNMSLINVTEKLEKKIGIPILGINAVTFWYALRENGFEKPLVKAGRLAREY